MKKWILKIPFRVGFGLPPWLHPMLKANFVITIFMGTMIIVVLVVALVLLRSFIQKMQLSNKQQTNDKFIGMHIVMNLASYFGVGLLSYNFMRISNPNLTCREIMQASLLSYRDFEALIGLLFMSQLSVYYICNRYA